MARIDMTSSVQRSGATTVSADKTSASVPTSQVIALAVRLYCHALYIDFGPGHRSGDGQRVMRGVAC
jgi:hypothetical protein